MAYTSDESRRNEVYIQPVPPTGGKWQVSTNGGTQARWRRDGKEMFYLSADGRLMATGLNATGPTLHVESPRPLFEPQNVFPTTGHNYAVTADGQRFLFLTQARETTETPLTVVVNWLAGLRR